MSQAKEASPFSATLFCRDNGSSEHDVSRQWVSQEVDSSARNQLTKPRAEACQERDRKIPVCKIFDRSVTKSAGVICRKCPFFWDREMQNAFRRSSGAGLRGMHSARSPSKRGFFRRSPFFLKTKILTDQSQNLLWPEMVRIWGCPKFLLIESQGSMRFLNDGR
jgi:hypothetical protein